MTLADLAMFFTYVKIVKCRFEEYQTADSEDFFTGNDLIRIEAKPGYYVTGLELCSFEHTTFTSAVFSNDTTVPVGHEANEDIYVSFNHHEDLMRWIIGFLNTPARYPMRFSPGAFDYVMVGVPDNHTFVIFRKSARPHIERLLATKQLVINSIGYNMLVIESMLSAQDEYTLVGDIVIQERKKYNVSDFFILPLLDK